MKLLLAVGMICILSLLYGCGGTQPVKKNIYTIIKNEIEFNSSNGFIDKNMLTQRHEKSYESIKDLLMNGASPNYKDGLVFYRTPLEMAITEGIDDTAILLIRYGADLNYTSPYTNEPLLITSTKKGMTNIIKEMIKKNIDVNAVDDRGFNALNYIDSPSVKMELIYALVDEGIAYKPSIKNENNILLKLLTSYNIYKTEDYLIKLAYLSSLVEHKSYDEVTRSQLGDGYNKYLDYLSYYRMDCALSISNWRADKKMCKNQIASGFGKAFNKYNYMVFDGLISHGYFKKGVLTKAGVNVYSGEFLNGSYKNGKLYKEGKILFSGLFKQGKYSKGTLYGGGLPYFYGAFIDNKPSGSGICYVNKRKEKCSYKNNQRVDSIHLARVKKERQQKELSRLKFCQSNPYPLSDVKAFINKIPKACLREYSSLVTSAQKYDPSWTYNDISSNYNEVNKCVKVHQKKFKKLALKEKYYIHKADKKSCNKGDPIYVNSEYYAQDMSYIEDGLGYADELRSSAGDIMEDVKSMRGRYISQKKQQEKDQAIGTLLGAITAYGQEYSNLKSQRNTQISNALNNQAQMQKSADQWAKTNQQRFSQGLGGISGKRYIDNSSSVTASSLNLNKDNEIGRSKPKDKGTHNYTFECEATGQTTTIPIPNYYTSSCDDALKVFSKVYACNLIDDMDSAQSGCVNACGRPDCMQAE